MLNDNLFNLNFGPPIDEGGRYIKWGNYGPLAPAWEAPLEEGIFHVPST